MTPSVATARAGSNIAFVKYWGNLNHELRIPMNNSLSMTLDQAYTTTTVTFSNDYAQDSLHLNGSPAGEAATQRAADHLAILRQLAGRQEKAKIVSKNSFPTGAGIASSASGFAALTVAAAGALGLDLPQQTLSRLARRGSGSASRSIDGGFVEWVQGSSDESSYARPLAPADHWDLVDVIAIISTGHKHVGSTGGHAAASSSPFFQARLGELATTLPQVREALLQRDLPRFGELIEAEAISLHVMAMTSKPGILYWQPGSLEVVHALYEWRRTGEAIGYFTFDAGPNVHIITEQKYAAAVVERLRAMPSVLDVLKCDVGGPARLIDSHLE
ncbi:MAG: diphosphomevalonate decarboxylase [Ardenticatenaceae bacterium]|nr:diphosphomevalonate decarboxylase [Ardenticatenaceae bacterium]